MWNESERENKTKGKELCALKKAPQLGSGHTEWLLLLALPFLFLFLGHTWSALEFLLPLGLGVTPGGARGAVGGGR